MVAMSEVEALSRRIVEEFDPDKIILFGSHAYGTAHKDSDVDLLVILPFEGSGLRKSVEILTRVSPQFPIDLVARRPEDAQGIGGRDSILREVLDRGRLLYERHRETMRKVRVQPDGLDGASVSGMRDPST